MKISFMRLKWINISLSIGLIISMFLYTFQVHNGFKQGLDFSGGTKIEIQRNDVVTLDRLRALFIKEKIDVSLQLAAVNLVDYIKIEFNTKEDSLLNKRALESEKQLHELGLSVNLVDYIKYLIIVNVTPQDASKVVFLGSNSIGPTIGNYLKASAVKLLLIALLLITVYVAFRFKMNYALGAMLSLLHDLLITIGFIGVLQIPLSIPVVAALLTILGYSINDTIVIYDRIRENISGKNSVGRAFEDLIDKSIKDTLGRTFNTVFATMLSVIGVYLFGGEGLSEMALVLLIGFSIGTYSSIFIASPIVVIYNNIFATRSKK